MERLENRLAPATTLTVGPNIDISQLPGDQSEAAIAIDPINPQHWVAVSNDIAALSAGMSANRIYISDDAGAHWSSRLLSNGDNTGTLGQGDPTVTFDQFGNLFFSYIDQEGGLEGVRVAVSFDGGSTFPVVDSIDFQPLGPAGLDIDHPAIAVGAGMVWVEYARLDTPVNVFAAGARVTGLGAVGPFGAPEAVPGSAGGNFGNISISPAGQVLVTFQTPSDGPGPSSIFVAQDPDGLGPAGFATPVLVTATNVGGFRQIPAQAMRTVDAEGVMTAFDMSGAHAGRVYLVYTDAPSVTSDNLTIYERFSDNSGATWSNRVQVNDDHSGNSHFLPQIAVDQSTGNLAVAWYDARNAGPADATVQIYAAVSTDGGATFSPNVRVSTGTSNSALANDPNDFGDYYRMTFVNGIFHAIWGDNSAALHGNPDAPAIDIATASVTVVTGPPSISGLVFVDTDGNGIQDQNEVGLPGVTITLTGVTAGGTPVFATVVTDVSGSFDFTGLAPGTYNLIETQPVNFVPGPAIPGNLGGTAGFDQITGIPLGDEQGVDYFFTQLGLTTNAISKAQLLGSLAGLIILSGPPGTGVTLVDPPLQPNTHYIVTGAGYGHAPLVSVYSTMNVLELQFYAYNPYFLGGVRVALGDVNGDGVPDIITAPGPGGGPDVRIFDGRNGDLIGEFMAYDPRLASGVFVAAGDVNRDGFADIVTSPDAQSGPEVKVFSGRTISGFHAPGLLADFMAYDPRWGGGVRVALADVNHDGVLDVITGAGPGGGPDVRVFGGAGIANAYPAGDIIREFYAFDPSYNGGVNVAGADVNGDGFADILVSGATTSAEVRIYSGLNSTMLGDFLAESAIEPAGLNIAALPTGLGWAGIITGGGTTSNVSVLNPTSHVLLDRFFTDATELTGVYVGGI
jgi:hypothetical protein